MKCSRCNNDNPDRFTTVVSGGGYQHQAFGSVPGSVNHGSLVLHGWRCMECGQESTASGLAKYGESDGN